MKLKSGFQMKQVGDRFFLFSEKTEDGMFVLNGTTKVIVENIQNGKSEDEILNLLTEDFNEDNSVIEKDFFEILTEMKEAGILIEDK